MPAAAPPLIKSLGRIDCGEAHAAMRAFTEARQADTPDEIWLCEHPPVYTQGIAGQAGHVLNAAGIPVLPTNRGGQVTFHGPGQVVAYPLIDLRRLSIYVKEYVFRLEQAVLKTLETFDVTGHRVPGAPGIYVRLDDPHGHARLDTRSPAEQHAQRATTTGDPFAGLGKIAALGVKVSQHCTYHGLALNVAMDLRPFDGINPCGYAGLRTVDLATLGVPVDWATVAPVLGQKLASYLSP